jgi:hypothetical protein
VINIGALWRYWKLFLSVLAFFNSLIAAMLACKKKKYTCQEKDVRFPPEDGFPGISCTLKKGGGKKFPPFFS